MSAPIEVVANARSLRGQPSAKWDDPGYRIVLDYRLSLGGPGKFAASVYRQRSTNSGKEGRPVHLLTLVGEPPHVLLRQVADLFDPDGPEIAE